MNNRCRVQSFFQRVVLLVSCATIIGTGLAAQCVADISFFNSPGAIQPDENVLFNAPSLLDAGLQVQGITNQTATIANFLSTESMITNAQGQARIEGVDGFLQSLTFSLDQQLPFTALEFNVRIPNNTSPRPTFTMTVTDVGGNIHVSQAYTLSNGQNFFSIAATNGMAIREVNLMASAQIVTQFQQFRVTAIPEPSSLLVIGLFASSLLGLRRRR